ncbi:hypothetical protein [Micromonospora craniellae]|uniref:hypothetical protein n=1 Tax=Micromonospora craniellae TaxID=2294034 RepID=UPI0011C0E4AE|nr:hypothetical protein [Micromonospora craniellae]QOC93777.1 hypothetical protein ID554_09170 [Micromonospora craniellae]
MNRGQAKKGTDLPDIFRLCLDPAAGPTLLSQLANAEAQLRADAARHARRWFNEHSQRSFRIIRAIPEGQDIHVDDLHLVGELLEGALT